MSVELCDTIGTMLEFPCFSELPRRYDTNMQLLYSYGRSVFDIIRTFEMEQDLYDFIDFCDECKVRSDNNGDLTDIFTIWHDVACVVLFYLNDGCLSIGTYGWEEFMVAPIREEIQL